MINPVFDNVPKLYVLAYENKEDRSSFSKYYMPTVEMKDFNVLINLKPFFELPIRNKKESYEKMIEISKVLNDYTCGNSLDYAYSLNHYKLIATDFSKQDVDLIRQQINFVGKLEQNATIFFIITQLEKTMLEFSQDFVDISLLACIKMESQKIINFLEPDDGNEKYFQTKNGTSLMIKTMVNIKTIAK